MTACDLRNVNAARVNSVHRPLRPNARIAIAIEGAAAVDLGVDAVLAYDA